jgi:uncharacterized protein DUF6894
MRFRRWSKKRNAMPSYRFELTNGALSEPFAVEDLPDDLAAQRHARNLGVELFTKHPVLYRQAAWQVRARDAGGTVVHEAPLMEGELHPMK